MIIYPPNGKMKMADTLEKSRNQLQRTAMFALYDLLTYMDMQEDVDVEMIVSGVSDAEYKDSPVYVKEIMIGTIRHYADMVNALESRMNKWTFARLNRVEQAILLLSLTHFFYTRDKVDKKVVINVAVELAKSYLDAKDYKFVNAILDKVLVNPENGPAVVKHEVPKEEMEPAPKEETKDDVVVPVKEKEIEEVPTPTIAEENKEEKALEPALGEAKEREIPEETKTEPIETKVEETIEPVKEEPEPLKVETTLEEPKEKKVSTKKKAAAKKTVRKPRAKKLADDNEPK